MTIKQPLGKRVASHHVAAIVEDSDISVIER
jgi:hypothetical protein